LDLTESYKYGLSVTGGVPPGSPTPGTLKLDDASYLLTGGLRYALFPAPAAPPGPVQPVSNPPAPPPARTYLVFFDWDKYNLTPRALQIISEAASDSKSTATTTLDVSGYTDTSGTPVYNQGLSLRRAKAVAAQLVADGVPESEIAIHAYGETHLLVPTGPGVREPQNRRVEIVLQ
jgi:outer membrane protein OmpA-like peptidoglycan-associated protein